MGIGFNDDCTRLAVPLLAPVLLAKPITSSHYFEPSLWAVISSRQGAAHTFWCSRKSRIKSPLPFDSVFSTPF